MRIEDESTDQEESGNPKSRGAAAAAERLSRQPFSGNVAAL